MEHQCIVITHKTQKHYTSIIMGTQQACKGCINFKLIAACMQAINNTCIKKFLL